MTTLRSKMLKASFVLLAGGFLLAGGTADAAEKISIRLDFAPVGLHAPMHLAKEKGWFEREGLDVDIQDGTGTLNTIQLVGAGQVDVGQVQLGLMLPARESGMPLKSFAGFLRRGDLAVIVPRENGPKTVADLRGKKLLCFTASPWVPFIDIFLGKGGLDRKSVNVTMVSPASMGAVYSAMGADGFLSVEHYAVPLVEKTRPSSAIRLADYGISIPSYGLLATEQTIKNRPDALRKIAKVQVAAWEYVRAGNIDDAVKAMIAQRPNVTLDPKILRDQLKLTLQYLDTDATKGKPIGWQAASDWQEAINVMHQVGVLTKPMKPEDVFTNELLPN
jgi:NitT/TauT family transport system substrate-binding protein